MARENRERDWDRGRGTGRERGYFDRDRGGNEPYRDRDFDYRERGSEGARWTGGEDYPDYRNEAPWGGGHRGSERGGDFGVRGWREGYGRESEFGGGEWGREGRGERMGLRGDWERADESWRGRETGWDRDREDWGDRWNAGSGNFGRGAGVVDRVKNFFGKGPRYNRPDDRIMEDVCRRLTQDPEVDASEIDVRVNNGEVTLSGTVDSRHAKRRAEEDVEDVWGVRDVKNEIRVSSREDTGILGRTTEPEPRRGVTGETGAAGRRGQNFRKTA